MRHRRMLNSVVRVCCESVNHRDTEDTEVAQRNQIETLVRQAKLGVSDWVRVPIE